MICRITNREVEPEQIQEGILVCPDCHEWMDEETLEPIPGRPRRPDEILADYDRGCLGLADIDMRAILWEVINDVRSSYRLAMKGEHVDDGAIDDVNDTVRDYLVNNYGDD